MPPLPHEAILSVLAEMGIAVVGFSMVAGVLRSQSHDEQARLFTLRDVAEIGLIGAVMSAFPLVVHAYGVSVDSTWRLASGTHGAWSVVAIAASVPRRGPDPLSILRRHWFIMSLVSGLVLSNFVLIGMNLAAPSPASGARFVTCMLLGLTQAGVMFLLAAFDMGIRKSAV